MKPQQRNGSDLGLDAPAEAAHIRPMIELRTVCVYCGSGPGTDPHFVETARALGHQLAANDLRLIYGGGGRGLMGTVARAVVEAGGKVTGIIPTFLLERESAFQDADEMIVTADMHERKRLMFERADAFVALPGGIGTLEELVEQMTWAQLGRHRKPILVANVTGFWDPLLVLLQHMRSNAFIRPDLEPNFLVADQIEAVVPMLRAAVRPKLVAEEKAVTERM